MAKRTYQDAYEEKSSFSYWDYEGWLKPKLEWLSQVNPQYHEQIIYGRRVPRTWSFDVWKALQADLRQKHLARECSRTDVPF